MCVCFLLLDCVLSLNVDKLGDRSFRRREEAHRLLAGCGPLAVRHLQRAQNSPDPEIARRATILLGPYAEQIAERNSHGVLPTSWPRRPWLFLDECEMSHYLSLARERLSKAGPPEWPEYREATRLWVRSRLLQRRPVEEIRAELDRMASEERGWIIQHGANYNPPLKLPEAELARGQ